MHRSAKQPRLPPPLLLHLRPSIPDAGHEPVPLGESLLDILVQAIALHASCPPPRLRGLSAERQGQPHAEQGVMQEGPVCFRGPVENLRSRDVVAQRGTDTQP